MAYMAIALEKALSHNHNNISREELNFEELYISAPLGATVISPVEGKISDLYVAEKLTRFKINY